MCYTVGCSQRCCSYFICFASIRICSRCTVCFLYKFYFLTPHPQAHSRGCETHATSYTITVKTLAYCTDAHHLIYQSFFSSRRLVCSFSQPFHFGAQPLAYNQHAPHNTHTQARKHTHTGTHTQGSLVGGGHGCSSSAQSQSGSQGSAASCLPASPGGIHSN